MKKLLLIGGGGHCRSVLDSVLSLGMYDEVGMIDKNEGTVLGVSVKGTDDDLQRLKKAGWTDAFITVGSIGDTLLRRRLFQMVEDIGFTIPTIIDSTAVIARNVTIGSGCFVGKKAILNTGSRIGKCAIINTGAIVEHDCKVGDFAHISPGTILCGQVTVGNNSHVGAGSVVRQQISIGNDTLIGVGSTIVHDISDNVKVYGNPGKVIE